MEPDKRKGACGVSPLGPEQILDPTIPAKAKFVSWVVNQGVTVVLLFAILIGVYIKAPEMLEQMQAGYDRNASELFKASQLYEGNTDRLLQVIESHAKQPIDIPPRPTVERPKPSDS